MKPNFDKEDLPKIKKMKNQKFDFNNKKKNKPRSKHFRPDKWN